MRASARWCACPSSANACIPCTRESVRAAGTSTVRRAREDSTFLGEAEAALGHPIEVISGIEEARLIYTGVTHSLPPNDGQRLVIDIGGGSTEVILGEGAKPLALESLHLGCVSMTERYFPGGRISREAFDRARVAARLELRPVKAFFRGAGVFEADRHVGHDPGDGAGSAAHCGCRNPAS